MELGKIELNLQTQYGKATDGRRNWITTPPGGEPCTYRVAFPTARGPRNCPVRVVRDRQKREWRCRFIYFTNMSRTPPSYGGRETFPIHGAPGGTCWWPGEHWTGGSFPPTSAQRVRREIANEWPKRICGRVQRGPTRTTENRLIRSPRLNTLGGSWWQETTTIHQWW